jgi:lantibiotic modifying enzyme
VPNQLTGNWRRLLRGAALERAARTVQAIAEALRNRPCALISSESGEFVGDAASLAQGYAGLALLYGYLAEAKTVPGAGKAAEHFLDGAVDAVAVMPMEPSLFGGFTGVAWATAHLDGRLFHAQAEDPNTAVDKALGTCLAQSPWAGDYDLVSGLVGIGVYALTRLSYPTARAILAQVIDRLDETAERGRQGITWLTPPERLPPHHRKVYPRGHYNLGVAHGVPGVIALLAGAWAAGVARKTAERLLEGAVDWLLAQRLPAANPSRFPSWVGPGTAPQPARSAWCYGDPGIACTLLLASRVLGEPSWEREALALAHHAAARSPQSAGVRDAGLCHGAAGLGHLFNRLYQVTDETRFAQAACFWLVRTLDLRQPGCGIAGFVTREVGTDGVETWVADPGILTGVAGIALALLAGISSIEPEWDRMLLVSGEASPSIARRPRAPRSHTGAGPRQRARGGRDEKQAGTEG